jgi:hypothetical protein
MRGRYLPRPANQSRNFYWKKKAFKKLGGPICRCCEEFRGPFLTIDHMSGDGIKHRKQIKGGHAGFYKWIATTKEDISGIVQILCMNCNWAKRYGPCPHTQDTLTNRNREMAQVLEEEIQDLEKQKQNLVNSIERIKSLNSADDRPAIIPDGWGYVRHVAPFSLSDFVSSVRSENKEDHAISPKV